MVFFVLSLKAESLAIEEMELGSVAPLEGDCGADEYSTGAPFNSATDCGSAERVANKRTSKILSNRNQALLIPLLNTNELSSIFVFVVLEYVTRRQNTFSKNK